MTRPMIWRPATPRTLSPCYPTDATPWAVLALWAKAEALERLNRASGGH